MTQHKAFVRQKPARIWSIALFGRRITRINPCQVRDWRCELKYLLSHRSVHRRDALKLSSDENLNFTPAETDAESAFINRQCKFKPVMRDSQPNIVIVLSVGQRKINIFDVLAAVVFYSEQ